MTIGNNRNNGTKIDPSAPHNAARKAVNEKEKTKVKRQQKRRRAVGDIRALGGGSRDVDRLDIDMKRAVVRTARKRRTEHRPDRKRQWHCKRTCIRRGRPAEHPVRCGSVVDLAKWG